MELVKKMLISVSQDKRVLALLIGWGFGNFMEGMAGFGTAVAIPASMLSGIGLDPMSAVLGCLVVNSTPTAFGSVGCIIVAAKIFKKNPDKEYAVQMPEKNTAEAAMTIGKGLEAWS